MDLPKNVQAGLVNANADVKVEAKVADNVHNQFGGTTTNDNSCQQIIQQNFYNISILPNINPTESIKYALSLGNENAELVGNNVQKLLTTNNISLEFIQEKLKNPEILSAIAKANKIAYLTNDIDKRKILSDLIYSKLTESNKQSSTILSIAIEELEILSNEHLKAMSFLYLVREKNFLKEFSIKQLEIYHQDILSKLIDFDEEDAKSLGEFLLSTKSVVGANLGWSISSYLHEDICKYNKENSIYKELDMMWDKLGFMGRWLSPIGKCLALKYLSDILGLNL